MEIYTASEKPSFECVYMENYDRLYKYAYTLLLRKEDAEDIVAETFISAYEHYDSYDPQKSSLSTWLSRIVHNKAANLLRSAAYRTRAELPKNDLRGAPDPEILRLTGENELLLALYEHLTEDEREFLNMRYTMELRDSEVAVLLGLSTKTVNKRYQRLLKKCRQILSPNGSLDCI